MKVEAKKRRSQSERRAETRRAFLDAAWEVYLRRGYARASAEEISAEAGYTRGAFYYNFGSRQELFVALLQDRVYATYREMVERGIEFGQGSSREAGAALGELQAGPTAARLFRLWLELLAESGRDERLRELAVGFWSGNRELLAKLIERDFAARGMTPPVAPQRLATAMIALDIGLSIQHHVDPEAAPLDLYPELFEALFEPMRSRD
jgi:AcrR family transcriptional regulator